MTKYFNGRGDFIGENLSLTFWRREDSEGTSSNGEIVASSAGKPPERSTKTQHSLGGGWVDYRGPVRHKMSSWSYPYWNGQRWGHISREQTERERREARGY